MSQQERRDYLKLIGGTVTGASIAGCLGGGTGGDGGGGGENDDEIPTPWTTDDLAEKAEEEGGPLQIYNTSDDQEGWDVIADVIREEYPFFEVEVQRGDRQPMAQRFLTEKQSGNIQADVILNVPQLYREEDPSDHFQDNIDNFQITQSLRSDFVDSRISPYTISNMFNYMPVANLVYNTEELSDEQVSLIEENGYNAFLDDAFAGARGFIDPSPEWVQFAGIVQEFSDRHPDDLSPEEWFRRVNDNLDMVDAPASSASSTRLVGQGQAGYMFITYTAAYAYINYQAEGELPMAQYTYQPTINPTDLFTLWEVDGAPHPWNARFARSVMWEDWFQKGLANARGSTLTPGNNHLDYSDTNLSPFHANMMNAELQFIGREQTVDLQSIGQEVYTQVR